MKESYKLPNGKITTSVRTQLKAWKTIYSKLEKAYNLVCYAYDPSFSFFDKDNTNLNIQLPKWFVERLNKKLEESKKPIEIKCPKCKNSVDINWGVGIENPDTPEEKVIRYFICPKCKTVGKINYIVESVEISNRKK